MNSEVTPKSGQPSANPPPEGAARVLSIDALRGLIMVIMAMDHANDILSRGYASEFWGGALRQFVIAAPFLTRLITHLCAPGFFFLMGIGMVYFWSSRRRMGWSETRVIRYFLLRGSVIILVHFLLGLSMALPRLIAAIRSGGGFGISINVLFALGLSMLLGAFLLRLSPWLLVLLSSLIIVLPEFILPDPAQFDVPVAPLLRLLAVPGRLPNSTVLYSLIPWLGLAILGLAFGKWLVADRAAVYRRLPQTVRKLTIF